MKTINYFQHFKTSLFHGVRVVAIPTLLASAIILSYLSIGIAQEFDIEFIGGVIISSLYLIPFLFSSFLGIVIISIIITSCKRLPNITVFILGILIGIVILAIGNYIASLFGVGSDEFTSLPSVFTVFLLAYAGQKMNRQANLDSSLELELRGGLWMALIAFVGSLTFVLIQYKNGIYWGSLYTYMGLGKALSISLPFAIPVGFLIGFMIKKSRKTA